MFSRKFKYIFQNASQRVSSFRLNETEREKKRAETCLQGSVFSNHLLYCMKKLHETYFEMNPKKNN